MKNYRWYDFILYPYKITNSKQRIGRSNNHKHHVGEYLKFTQEK